MNKNVAREGKDGVSVKRLTEKGGNLLIKRVRVSKRLA